MTILMLEMTCEICRVNLKISLSHIGLLERSIEQMNHFLRLAEGHHFLLFSADIATYIQGIFDKEWCFQWLTDSANSRGIFQINAKKRKKELPI